jgi:sugar phosphate isomerase/epimerase
VYASKYPPDWDCTPIIEQVFSDLHYAGIDGLEVMHSNLRHANAVETLKGLSQKYSLPVIGSSYGADFRKKEDETKIVDECSMFFEKLHQLGATNFGISVGEAGRKKTEEELDQQAEVLKKIRRTGSESGLTCNLHNHTYEVVDNMHDLRGTLKRIPDFPLGPDLNWLIRGGVDPVSFIREFKQQIIYLHIRDQYKSGEWSEAVGEGDTDFKAISKALHEINFSGTATIELAFPGNFTPTRSLRGDWKMSRDTVRKEFGY